MSFQSNKKPAFLTPMKSRFFLVRAGILLAFSSLGLRLMYVQGVLRTELIERADRQAPVKTSDKGLRHRIDDRNGLTLAETVQVSSCFVDPSMMKNKSLVAKQLAPLLGLNENQLSQRLKKTKKSFFWVRRDVPPHIVSQIKSLKIPGVGFKQEARRHYPMGVMAGHLLGFVGYEGTGLSGIETAFEKVLTKKNVPVSPVLVKGAKPSGHVQLTIDATLQKIVERELEWGVKKTGAKKGMVVVQDPWNGEILAMATWPHISLDPDHPSAPGELRVPSLVDAFEPGSTFKVVIAAAAIEEKVVSTNETFNGEKGAWKVADITIHDHEPLKRMTFDDIFIHSSNIGTAKLAERVGTTKLYQYARLFGFGVQPGSGLIGETKGILRTPNKWSGVSKYVVSFGQEISVTAVQMVGAYSAIANGGVLMEPRLVKRIVDDSGDTIWDMTPSEVRRIISQDTARKITAILTRVVEKGTGINAQIQWDPATKVAGKTGTAQKWNKAKHRYDEFLTLVSFVGFFPADKPKMTMLVILDEPARQSWGGLDAAPIFRRIAEQMGTDSPMLADGGSRKSS